MRNILSYLIVICCLVGCKERGYVNENSFCVYKNYIVPDTIPYNIDVLVQFDSSLMHSSSVSSSGTYNNVIYLNAYKFIQNKHQVQDSLYFFLCKEYLKCKAEYEMNKYGVDNVLRDLMLKMPKDGCFYYCGQLFLHKSVLSLIFMQVDNVNERGRGNLILFNINNRKICSIVTLSKYCNEKREEDLALKTYLINNSSFISVLSPVEDNYTKYESCLIKKDKKVDFERSNGNKELSPFRYSVFYIDNNGYVILVPTSNKLNNINILNKEGRISNTFEM